jgi:puromycin-sensitive aminopeptidase
MPVDKEEKLDNSLKLLKFDRSPIMSTYLVAVVVGEYDYVEGKSDDGVLVRVYTPVGKKDQGKFALDVAIKVLPYYKDYFQIAYPLPKMDLIAISDFSCGAMENWGLITYRETRVLVDPENTSLIRKQGTKDMQALLSSSASIIFSPITIFGHNLQPICTQPLLKLIA